ncbi:MAG: exodeoxyribonuclease III [Candidatus Delongbacteria bacterium]|nr:exodeoxyribonuclease III [Candidatus Delongbacteria bacterium]
MKIYSFNVNGIRAASKKGFFEWLDSEKPDILCLQETKIHDDQLEDDMRNREGYHSYFSFAVKKGYSGTAVYSKIKPKNVTYGVGIEEFDTEGRIVQAEYKDFTLLNIYFPNGQMSDTRLDYKLRFYDAILEHCEKLRSAGTNLVICGDYNTAHHPIDLKNPKSNETRSGFLPVEREWMTKFENTGYVDTFRKLYPEKVEYSWWSYRFNARQNNAGWRIDYHFVNKEFFNKVKDSYILNEVEGSDHCPVVLELDL